MVFSVPPLPRRWTASACLTIGLLALGACGDDDLPPPPDAQPLDLARVDGGSDDLGADGTDSDARMLTDGSTTDGAMRDGSPPVGASCEPAGDAVALAEDTNAATRRVALAASAGGVLAAWTQREGFSDDVWVRMLARGGGLGDAQRITEDRGEAQSPALLAHGDGFIVSWSDNADRRPFEVLTRALDSTGAPTGESVVVSGEDGFRHEQPTLALSGATPYLAYVRADALGDRRAMLQPLTDTGAASGAPVEIVPVVYDVAAPRLVARAEAGMALIFVDTKVGGLTDDKAVWLQLLSPVGATVGDPSRVDTAGDGAGSAAAILSTGTLGVVYGVRAGGSRNEVRFRPFAPTNGAALGAERRVVPGSNRDPGVSSYFGAFAVAYRALSSATMARIELALTSTDGETVATLPLEATSVDGGAVSIVTDLDGSLVIAWTEQLSDGGGARLWARRVICQ